MTRKFYLDDETYTSIHKCTRCGQCTYGKEEAEFVTLCPMYKEGKFFSYSAGGVMQIARALYEGKMEYSETLKDILYHCTTCTLCEANCGVIDNHLDIMAKLKQALHEHGIPENPQLQTVVENIFEHKNPYGEQHETRNSWLNADFKSSTSPRKPILYFTGCVSAYDQKQIPQAFIEVLHKLDIPFLVSDDEWCCGIPLFYSGYLDKAYELARHNMKMIAESGVETVVFSCPTCTMAFKHHYPAWLKKPLPFKVLHTTEYLEQLANEGVLKLGTVQQTQEIFYHDSCHLGRGLGIYDPPRRLLEGIEGAQLQEFELARENSHCCGGGGMLPVVKQGFSSHVAKERIAEMDEHNVDMLVSACPNCKKTLRVSARRSKHRRIRVMDVTELINEVLA